MTSRDAMLRLAKIRTELSEVLYWAYDRFECSGTLMETVEEQLGTLCFEMEPHLKADIAEQDHSDLRAIFHEDGVVVSKPKDAP